MEPRWRARSSTDKIRVADGICYYITKHPFLSSPSSRAVSALASRSLDSCFSRASMGNQSTIKFINAQSTFAGRVRGLAGGVGGCAKWCPDLQRRKYLQRSAVPTEGDLHIGQFDSRSEEHTSELQSP